jgi:signal transduction histidine kinase
MKLKLFRKYFLAAVSIVVVSIVMLMILLSLVLNNYINSSTYDTLRQSCIQIDENLQDFTDSEAFSKIAVPLSKVSRDDIFITDTDGTVLMCSCEDWQERQKCMHSSYIIPKEIIDKSVDRDITEIDTLGIYKFPHYVFVRSLGEENEQFIFATAPIYEARNLIKRISRIYYMWAVIPVLFMVLAMFVMTYRLTKPLRSMSEAAKAMAKGDFSKRVPVTSDDEMGELAASFNMMTNSLSRLEGMRRSFVGNVSHELKTPMTTIGGFIDGMLDGTIKPSEHEYYLGIVSQEVKRLSRLVENMLSISRLESKEFKLKPERFDFYELLCTIMISQEQRIEKKGIIITGLDNLDNTPVCCDKDLIHQVVYNLVDNAIKFTDEGGEIRFSLSSDNDNLNFTITNTGVGIPEKELPLVFDRFYKTDKSRSSVKNSTGLGLYIAKTIVSAHKGKISVTSKENEFTEFKITLPKEI